MQELHDVSRVLFAAPDAPSTPLSSSSSQPRSPVGILKNRFVNMEGHDMLADELRKLELDFPELDVQLVNAYVNVRLAHLQREHLIGHLQTSIHYMGRLAGYNPTKWRGLLAKAEDELTSLVNPTWRDWLA